MLVAFLVVAGLLAGWHFWTAGRKMEPTAPRTATAPTVLKKESVTPPAKPRPATPAKEPEVRLDAFVYYNRALLYKEMGEYEKARRDYQKGKDLDRNIPPMSFP
jgi:tetratricopeptide (TPR) repeat protein